MNTAIIHTHQQPRRVSEIRAAQTAARARDPRRAVDAPRGRKGRVLELSAAIRRARNAARPDPLATPLAERANRRLAAIYTAVIEARGGETSIEEKDRSIPLTVIHRADGLTLLAASGWRHYSSRFGARPATIRYLCGRDDNGRWAVRVPSTVGSVGAALAAITPEEVKKARRAGKRVLRQGDCYAIETTKAHDGKGTLPERHTWDEETRTLRHLDADNAHGALTIPWPVRFVTQSTLRMGRTARRGRGD